MLIHALPESPEPARKAFAAGWPEAQIFNLMDDSLARDLTAEGEITPRMHERFLALGHYAASAGANNDATDAILFTCSAFGPAIDKVKRALTIPVLRPNEAAFEEALAIGSHIGLLVSFKNSLPPLIDELEQMARERGKAIQIQTGIASGALEALKDGDGAQHDQIVADCANAMINVDVLVLCQFSLARAASRIAAVPGRAVLTTPDSAVAKLRRTVSG